MEFVARIRNAFRPCVREGAGRGAVKNTVHDPRFGKIGLSFAHQAIGALKMKQQKMSAPFGLSREVTGCFLILGVGNGKRSTDTALVE